MTHLQLDRLEKLAKHLKKGKLAHDTFNFAEVNDTSSGLTSRVRYAERGCGTNGCAYGEIPKLWPKQFRWSSDYVEPTFTLRGVVNGRNMFEVCRSWFGLSDGETYLLFVPVVDRSKVHIPKDSGCRVQRASATFQQVGNNIMRFVIAKRKTLVVVPHPPKLPVKLWRMRLDKEYTLETCPPGLFLFDRTLGFKTEYRDTNGPEAYVVASGEYFWGGVAGLKDARRQLVVIPLRIKPPLVRKQKP